MEDRFQFSEGIRQFAVPQKRSAELDRIKEGAGTGKCSLTLWEQAWSDALGNLRVSIAEARRRYLEGRAQHPYRASKCWRVVGPRYPDDPERETAEICLKVFGRIVPDVFGPGVDKLTFYGQPRAMVDALKAMRDQVSRMTNRDQNLIARKLWLTAYQRKVLTKLNKNWDYDEDQDLLVPRE